MSGNLRLNGSTSGYSELRAPDVANDQVFLFPAVGGTLMTTDQVVSPDGLWSRTDTTLSPANPGDDLANIGTITASGEITSGGDASTAATGVKAFAEGGIYVSSATDSGYGLWRGYTTGNPSPTSSIDADGSITAAGDLKLDGAGTQLDFVSGYGGYIECIKDNNSKFKLNDDGTSFFSSNMEVGGSITAASDIKSGAGTEGGTIGAQLFPSGGVTARNSDPTKQVFGGYKPGDSSPTFSVTGNGSITAAGQLTASMVRSDNTGQNSVFLGYGDAGLTSQIWADGTITTVGEVSAANGKFKVNGDGTATVYGTDGTFSAFTVYAGASNTAFIKCNGEINTNNIVYSNRPANTDFCFVAQNAGTNNAVIRADGTYFGQNNAIQPISSERRLKENIAAIDSEIAWETIKNTPYYSYNFIGSKSTVYGPMADEVPAEMIVQPMEENEEGVMVARSDDQGPIRSYDNGMLQARLYTALQTALTRIEELEAKVAALES